MQLAANRFKYNGKEEQVTGNLEWLDYGARMYDSGLGRWFSGDPLQERYYPLSSYSYCSGNPVKFVDIEGMWIDNYQLMADGSIVFLEKTDDAYDVLYASNSAKKGDVNVNEFVTIYDRTILPSLSGKPTSLGTHYAFTRDAVDAFNLFKFVADNSNVEWGLNGFMHDGKEIYSIRTNNNDRFVRMVYFQYKESNITFSLHSHPWGRMKHRKLQVSIKMDIWEIWPRLLEGIMNLRQLVRDIRKIFLGIIYITRKVRICTITHLGILVY